MVVVHNPFQDYSTCLSAQSGLITTGRPGAATPVSSVASPVRAAQPTGTSPVEADPPAPVSPARAATAPAPLGTDPPAPSLLPSAGGRAAAAESLAADASFAPGPPESATPPGAPFGVEASGVTSSAGPAVSTAGRPRGSGSGTARDDVVGPGRSEGPGRRPCQLGGGRPRPRPHRPDTGPAPGRGEPSISASSGTGSHGGPGIAKKRNFISEHESRL